MSLQRGNTQTYGVDYQDAFATIAKMNTIQILLSLATNLNWSLQQFDVNNAFLHGDLEKEVYMKVPPSVSHRKYGNKVCGLKKSLYGLKQFLRAWFGKFTKSMVRKGQGFVLNQVAFLDSMEGTRVLSLEGSKCQKVG